MEGLEPRALLTAVPGVDYALTGYRWADPGHITYSIVPDGVQSDHGITNLNATFNARFGNGPWQRTIALALATWAAAANINISQMADAGLPFNTSGLEQGDPRFGDIRFAGYAYPDDTTTLARTYFPPPNAGTASGDDEINTTMDFNVGADYDLYSVMLHETGLALGLAEITDPTEVMYGLYTGIRAGLSAGDRAGIQALYGGRTADPYQQQGQGLAVSSAIDITSTLDAAHQSSLNNLALATSGDTEYFSVVAPPFPGATLKVTAAAGNISLLSPQVTILDTAGRTLAVQGDPGAWGDNATAQTNQIVPGQRYTIAVTGATHDAFAVGAYRLDVTFAGDPSVVRTPPAAVSTGTSAPFPAPTTTAGATAPLTTPLVQLAPVPSDSSGAAAQPTPLGTVGTAFIGGLSLVPGTSRAFSFRTARAGVYRVSAPGTAIRVLDGSGNLVAAGDGHATVRSRRPGATFLIEIGERSGRPVASYSLSIIPVSAGLRPHARGPAPHRLPAPRIHHP